MYPHYSPITKTGQTNLLPIVYPALIDLGFSSARIESMVNSYIRECGIKDLKSVYFIANDFETHYLNRLAYFNEQIVSQSVETVVANYLKDKKRSLSSAMFLGLTRLGMAIREGKSERIIHALAYYDCIATELKITGQPVELKQARKSFIALMQRRRIMRGLSLANEQAEKIRIIIQHQEHLLALPRDAADDDLYAVMLETFTEWYIMTEDIHVLHVILGFHALTALQPLLAHYSEWLCEFWLHAQVYALMTKKSLLWKRVDLLSWDDLLALIGDASDFHNIMLFYAVYESSQHATLDFLRHVAQISVANQLG